MVSVYVDNPVIVMNLYPEYPWKPTMGQRSAVLVVLVVFASVSCLTRDLLLPREGKLWGVGFFAQGIDLKTLGRMPQTLRGYVVTTLDSLSQARI